MKSARPTPLEAGTGRKVKKEVNPEEIRGNQWISSIVISQFIK